MPPEKKKPAARSKPKPRAKTTQRKTSAPATKRTPRRPAQDRPPVEITRDEEDEQPSGARPVAVGSTPPPLWESELRAPVEPPTPVTSQPKPSSSVVDTPWAELGVAVSAALLAASVFLPWYHGGVGTVSGWNSGTWGPIIFFLALAALTIVALRRAQIGIAFPVEAPLVVEGIGWLCVIGLILKRYFQPIAFGAKLPPDGWIFASLACALALALLAGFASSNTAFVFRPNWFKGRAGVLGAGVIAVALAGGLSLGFTNTSVPLASPSVIKPQAPPAKVNGLPKCATRLHLVPPAGFTPIVGYDYKSGQSCIASWRTTLTLNKAYSQYVGTLRNGGWTVKDALTKPDSRSAVLSGRACGSVTVLSQGAGTKKTITVSAIVFDCPAATPSR